MPSTATSCKYAGVWSHPYTYRYLPCPQYFLCTFYWDILLNYALRVKQTERSDAGVIKSDRSISMSFKFVVYTVALNFLRRACLQMSLRRADTFDLSLQESLLIGSVRFRDLVWLTSVVYMINVFTGTVGYFFHSHNLSICMSVCTVNKTLT